VPSLARRDLLLATLLAPLLAPAAIEAATVSGGAKVFVAGATGNTGKRIVAQLSAKGYKVLAGIRDQKKADSLFGKDSNVTIVKFNLFYAESIAGAIGDADAVVSALGYSGFNLGKYKEVDLTGTVNLIEGAKKAGVKKFVLLTSLLTNAKAIGQENNPNYKFLNAFGGVLDNKLEAEKALRSSGLDWTIVRPGGLSNEAPENLGGLYVSKEDTLLGVDSDPGRSISRDTVAEVIVEALSQDKASNKVVEIVQGKQVEKLQPEKYFDI
jgi:uncharacterized protein YbjT (DUF2867 family)